MARDLVRGAIIIRLGSMRAPSLRDRNKIDIRSPTKKIRLFETSQKYLDLLVSIRIFANSVSHKNKKSHLMDITEGF
jgi:hypothetical protein